MPTGSVLSTRGYQLTFDICLLEPLLQVLVGEQIDGVFDIEVYKAQSILDKISVKLHPRELLEASGVVGRRLLYDAYSAEDHFWLICCARSNHLSDAAPGFGSPFWDDLEVNWRRRIGNDEPYFRTIVGICY
jgi:hypothetical protein